MSRTILYILQILFNMRLPQYVKSKFKLLLLCSRTYAFTAVCLKNIFWLNSFKKKKLLLTGIQSLIFSIACLRLCYAPYRVLPHTECVTFLKHRARYLSAFSAFILKPIRNRHLLSMFYRKQN